MGSYELNLTDELLGVIYKLVDRVFPNNTEKHDLLAIVADHMSDVSVAPTDQPQGDEEARKERERVQQQARERQAKVEAANKALDSRIAGKNE